MITSKTIKTIGDLKEFIKNLPDDMLVVKYQKDMEKRGYQNNAFCNITNMKKETKTAYDSFDYISYSYEVFVESEDGISCLEIN